MEATCVSLEAQTDGIPPAPPEPGLICHRGGWFRRDVHKPEADSIKALCPEGMVEASTCSTQGIIDQLEILEAFLESGSSGSNTAG